MEVIHFCTVSQQHQKKFLFILLILWKLLLILEINRDYFCVLNFNDRWFWYWKRIKFFVLTKQYFQFVFCILKLEYEQLNLIFFIAVFILLSIFQFLLSIILVYTIGQIHQIIFVFHFAFLSQSFVLTLVMNNSLKKFDLLYVPRYQFHHLIFLQVLKNRKVKVYYFYCF